MKTLPCDICDVPVEGETFDEWFKAMHTHYMSEHADLMKDMMSRSKEEGEKELKKEKEGERY